MQPAQRSSITCPAQKKRHDSDQGPGMQFTLPQRSAAGVSCREKRANTVCLMCCQPSHTRPPCCTQPASAPRHTALHVVMYMQVTAVTPVHSYGSTAPSDTSHLSTAAAVILGDIGGTNARFELAQANLNTGERVDSKPFVKVRCADQGTEQRTCSRRATAASCMMQRQCRLHMLDVLTTAQLTTHSL